MTSSMPLFLSCFILITSFSAFLMTVLKSHKHTKKLTKEREEETICSFARQLNCRETDTWIVRAVYEEMLNYLGYPPHLDDEIDIEDMEDIARIIAKRIGRSLKDTEKNPHQEKLNTVGQMILFFTAQPLDERPISLRRES